MDERISQIRRQSAFDVRQWPLLSVSPPAYESIR